jgi:hypothetical protein
LERRFELHNTPTKANWLNMAEIERSIVSNRCLDGCIGDTETLEREALAWARQRDE